MLFKKFKAKTQQAMDEMDGIQSITTKLTINDDKFNHDMYVKIGWFKEKPVWIELTLSQMSQITLENGQKRVEESEEVTELRRHMVENSRVTMEIICKQASSMLQGEDCGIEWLAALWRGTKFEPSGKCVALAANDPTKPYVKVKSPLDAVAQLIEMKMDEWKKKIRDEEKWNKKNTSNT